MRPILLVIAVRAHPAIWRGDENALAVQVFFILAVSAASKGVETLLPTVQGVDLFPGEGCVACRHGRSFRFASGLGSSLHRLKLSLPW